MSTFEGNVLSQTIAVATDHKIEPAALLAVVEVESAGKSLEIDGKTPCLLFERHIFYRELKKAGKTIALDNAVALGLANTSWQPKTQYKDQAISSARLKLYARAKVVDAECAARSCSWGVGQTMGFLAEEMHFPNAVAMLDYMTTGGVPAQVECMVREIENHKLTAKLNAHNWAGFAKVYNGPGYATNHYDTKMQAAWERWRKNQYFPTPQKPEVAPPMPVVPPTPIVTPMKASVGTGVFAIAGATWAGYQSLDFKILASIVFVAILAAITGIVLWKRSRETSQLGTLSTVDIGSGL